ncbi:preprotein translocase subunit SecA [Candidatus Parcubacteria bacterium]|nr:preprotein translocase subunit SecA [Patescibacteria group bacterium]MBU4467080.1 preprotein translocase subunit SecA [Patescibacteria group bacterium]MCG2688775.1 preprotein translocase subunit SecA [Candidatus Parcubacteria bacterium]
MALLDKIFGDPNEKYLKSLAPLIEKINSLEKEIEGFDNEKLKEKSLELTQKVTKGESLDSILPEAFALAREAAKRNLKQRHFDVQLLGGIVLHQGKIAQMLTGEGKTLAATLPLYLNALEGKGCHLVTVNDYLAKRDAIWMGQIYNALGLSTGCVTQQGSFMYDPNYKEKDVEEKDRQRDETGSFKIVEDFLRPCTKKEAYEADVTYGTNNEFGFDYLRDNMVYDLANKSQRDFNFAIVDEVDSILIDEARTPLIISAPEQEPSKMYQEFSRIIPSLKKDEDYQIDEKLRVVTLTEEGINHVEKIMGMTDIYQQWGIKQLHHLEQSLKAETLFEKDKDYVVKNNQILIVDEFTGRILPGRRWSGGLHQAIEAKERVTVQPESLTLGTITFQNYFRMYKKLSGMTGTALTSAEEFAKVYKLEAISIPTNRPLARKDLSDKVLKSENGKYKALVKEIKERNEKGQPVLVGTRSVQKNEYLGELLSREGVPHQILNAKHHEQEGQIIAQAGQVGAVTIATNMAGRGVDIILGGNPPDPAQAEKVKELGGLHIIGTERHDARRIDDQLRGRGGRQGDPGSSQFFLSLEDDLMRVFGGDSIKKMMEVLKIPEDEPIEASMVSKAIEEAQSKIEGFNLDMRSHVLEYDDVINKHRETIYRKRKEILERTKEKISSYALELLEKNNFSKEDYQKKQQGVGPDNFWQIEKFIFLKVIDNLWIDHLENLQTLQDAVRLRAYGQKDPLVEFKNEAHKMFQSLLTVFEAEAAKVLNDVKPSLQTRAPAISPSIPGEKKVNRNDPCPCGAKKSDGSPVKYKHCHGK